MSKDEIIDKIKSMACHGAEFEAVYVNLEKLQALIACLKCFCEEEVEYISPQDGIYIANMLEMAKKITSEVDSGLDVTAQAIIDLTSLSVQTEAEMSIV